MGWHLRKPTNSAIQRFLASLDGASLNYPTPGCSREACPKGYKQNHLCQVIGHGRAAFDQARRGLRAWAMVRELEWLELCRQTESEVAVGQVVATLTQILGVWTLNPCKIVYCQGLGDDDHESTRAEFGYGTLPGHVFMGEERFTVVFDPPTGTVRYELMAYTRPAALTSALGRPLASVFQRRFARDSADAMRDLVGSQ